MACKERRRQPIQGKFTQDPFYFHSRFKWQGLGSHHGPRVDVEQGTALARAWLALTIAHAQWIARVFETVNASGDGAVVPSWNQRQFTQNVREGNNIHHRLWGWQVHTLGSNLGSAGPPIFRLSLAIIVQGSISAHWHSLMLPASGRIRILKIRLTRPYQHWLMA